MKKVLKKIVNYYSGEGLKRQLEVILAGKQRNSTG